MCDTVQKYMRLLESIQPGEVAIDCGANVGEVTRILSANGACVHSFEPNPYAFEVLSRRFRDCPNVVCHNAAVMDKAGTVRLYFHENSNQDEVYWSTGSSVLEFKGNVDRNKFVDVEAVDISEFIGSLRQPVKLLKIDVEGVECAIVEKLIEQGRHLDIDHIFVEMHYVKVPELRAESEKLVNKIRGMGIENIHLDWM